MCFNDGLSSSTDRHKYKFKCTVIAVVSLVFHVVLSCVAIAALTKIINTKSTNIEEYLQQSYSIYLGKIDYHVLFIVSGFVLFFGVLGIFASIMLLIGSKYNKPGFVVVYICYGVQLGIILLISGLLVSLKLHWSFAIIVFCNFVVSWCVTMAVYRSYEAMTQETLLKNSISDLTQLIQEDSLEDSLISLS